MISVIVAVAQNGVIGDGNKLLWHISEDLQMFKRVTTAHPVVMGRRTFESLGRPLPNRTNVVISRRSGYNPSGVEVVGSLGEAIALFEPDQEVFIIGGGEVYRQAMPLADRLYLTHIFADYRGDTHFTEWDTDEWTLVSSQYHERGKDFPHPFEFLVYDRNKS